MFKNYNIVGNNEMIAFGMMNIVGSLTSCYLITGPFSRSAVNFNAGCKTIVSNIVMAIAVMFTLLFLTPLFYYTPLVVLSSIIMVAMRVGGGYINSKVVAIRVKAEDCSYPYSRTVPGLLILEIDAPIYFANAGYLRERITSWIDEEEERVKTSGENSLQYVILDMSAGGNIDTSGISMMEEIKKIMDRRKLKLVLVNPKGEVVKKLTRSKFIGDNLDKEWMFMTVGEAVEACSYVLHTLRTVPASKDSNNV
ncbi:sulfate transporter 3.1 [Brassica rapa]|uniref:sulfate transporter 3.1 n=1 Tax=Brassica campestris TaxID=3711 RepID=UPI00142E1420|nr:sulfate transporter 3.1 [Brassica rapa]